MGSLGHFPSPPDESGVHRRDDLVFALIITTEGNSRLRQLQAGMLFQRLWLKAIHDGYAVVPASQPLQEYAAMAEICRAIHQDFSAPGQTIQMVAFLGRPAEGYRRGFRLAAQDLLRAS